MAKSKGSRGKSKAAKGAGRTAPKRSRRAAAKPGDADRVALKKWVSALTAKQLRKLAALKVIVEDPCTCERIGTPQLGECEWTVKWENSGA